MISKTETVPHHVGLIMDGNRRWAKEKGLSGLKGHMAGYNKMKDVPEWFFDRGVKIVSVYAFSTENWKRSRKEVNYLMRLLKKALKEELGEFHKRGYRLMLSGRTNELPGELPELCKAAEKKTRDNKNGTLNICINYGGRAELVDAFKGMLKKKVKPKDVTEELVQRYLYHQELSDPDMIVRTSGENRMSGFQLWRSSYSEFFSIKKYWPDFSKRDVGRVLREYQKRTRKFGGDAT